MNDTLELNDFIDSSIKLGDEKDFKAGKKLKDASVSIQENIVIDKLKQVFDPEIPVSVYDLGLIYKIERFSNGNIKPTVIAKKIRNFTTPIIGYIKGNKFYIDFKAIPSDQINDLIKSLQHCLQ